MGTPRAAEGTEKRSTLPLTSVQGAAVDVAVAVGVAVAVAVAVGVAVSVAVAVTVEVAVSCGVCVSKNVGVVLNLEMDVLKAQPTISRALKTAVSIILNRFGEVLFI